MMMKVLDGNMVAVIDEIICDSCGVCIPSCPERAIRRREERVIILNVFCRGCGLCVDNCPVGAISIREED
jgi:Pyruvate/2-oxoacid:ferredoxin oxidoreductase delta subunit